MRRGWRRTALRVLMFVVAFAALVAFSVLLAELTLTPSPASEGIAGSNLQPGHSLRQYAEDYTFLGACKQVGGNLLIGAPFGILLPVLVPRRLRMVRVVVLTALVMVLVELAQGALVEGRAFDVDDVILNTSGAIIAYALIGRFIGRKYHALAEPVPVRRRRFPLPGRSAAAGASAAAVEGTAAQDGTKRSGARAGWFGTRTRRGAESGGSRGNRGKDALDAKPTPAPKQYRTLKRAKRSEESRARRTMRNIKQVKPSDGLERRTGAKASKSTGTTKATKATKAATSARGGRAGGPAKSAGGARAGKPAKGGGTAGPAGGAATGEGGGRLTLARLTRAFRGTGEVGAKPGK
ncbi:VanZ family protein [Streptomyces fuscigenes]|uniref:VanZ family protein n=1 Tax=Streptomyces fuscigenes TaxID=1528880 RepID=UPI003557FE2B